MTRTNKRIIASVLVVAALVTSFICIQTTLRERPVSASAAPVAERLPATGALTIAQTVSTSGGDTGADLAPEPCQAPALNPGAPTRLMAERPDRHEQKQYEASYWLMREADAARRTGDRRAALSQYEIALAGFRALRDEAPQRRPDLVGFRVTYLERAIEELRGASDQAPAMGKKEDIR